VTLRIGKLLSNGYINTTHLNLYLLHRDHVERMPDNGRCHQIMSIVMSLLQKLGANRKGKFAVIDMKKPQLENHLQWKLLRHMQSCPLENLLL
jgi:hypothetical protein